MENVRVRFAPSPTGPLHIGGVRTALFNYLFAKKHNGTFVLRIEDTDQTRFVANAEQYILDSLQWLGISPDETIEINEKFGPYRQSERKEIYKKYAEQLIESGKAYYAFDTPESLDELRKDAEAKKETFIYNWSTRNELENSTNLSQEDVEKRIVNGDKFVVRFKMYDADDTMKTIESDDIVRGNVSFKKELLDDKIIFKSDGLPTYHLANIVDDHLMEISHVIRGEEWLPSLPLHVALYNAFGWEAPTFAHLPLILKPTGKGKLSKRDGDKLGFPVFPLAYTNEKDGEVSRGYREDGYFPETVNNFLAFLGWNPGTEQELFSLEELIQEFDLTRVNKAGARFDPDKTKWYNQQYLQQKSNTELAELFIPFLESKGINSSKETVAKIVGLVKERASFITDLWDLSSYFFEAPSEYDAKNVKKQWKENTGEILTQVSEVMNSIENFEAKEIESAIKGWITENELGFGKVMPPLRLTQVGALSGPDLFEIIEFLGKEETVNRIKKAIEILG